MKEPKMTVRFSAQIELYINEVRIGLIESEGISLWPSNFRALADALPALTKVIERAEDELLAIQSKLNEGQRVAQTDLDALNADS
jgi:hypothetical protein